MFQTPVNGSLEGGAGLAVNRVEIGRLDKPEAIYAFRQAVEATAAACRSRG